VTTLAPHRQKELYRLMLTNRLLEERLVNLYRQGKVVGGLYRSLGQEATSVGAAAALEDGDLMIPLIRNLGATLVRGVRPRDLFAQHMGRATAPSKGRDGILHFSIAEKGIYAPSGMLGTALPVLAGMCLADRMSGRRTVGLTFIGDGGTSVGAFHEGLNFAAVQRLPVVVMVEFNGWAYSTPYSRQCAARTLADKAVGYGMPSEVVDGNDVLEVHAAARRAVERARSGGGSTLVECKTYRMKGHAEHDAQSYVDSAELEEWRRRDPIARFERRLEDAGIVSEFERHQIARDVASELDHELAAAESAPLPDRASLLSGVFADEAIVAKGGEFTGGF
jgi:pyruvate dehydrogenase E1 component alpha subunit/2-oxoisovalerate dehydrogenase E1 component alpha subunit